MSRIKNILFGKIAVSTKFITDEQLDECLQEQIDLEGRGERVPKLGELLEQKGYLTKRQIRSLLETMQNMQRRLFGEVATSFQFVTLDQVQTCLEIQRYLKEQPENVPLFGQALVIYREYVKSLQEGAEPPRVGEIMVAMGFLKPHQVDAVLEEQNKKIVECENCEASLNVTNFAPGQKVKCGQCQTVLQIVTGETGDLEAVVPQESAEEEALPTGDEQVESFAESPEPLLAEDQEQGEAAVPAHDLSLHEDTSDSDLKLVKPITLGDFRVIAKLGQDSTGTLYKSEQMSKHRIVVLKLMNKSTMNEGEFQSKFVSEAKKVAGLDHKNIKRIFSLGKIGERYFVAQEYVEGESVHKLLEREQRIPYARALEIGVQVAEALEYAAKRGVLHHDLRPSNILVLPNGGVKVAQMGLATKSTENIMAISKSGGLAPFYIAPEIVTEDRALDHRTDIYSLGAILFHTITGRPPYQGSSPFEILVRLTEETIPPLKFFDPSIPDPVCQIVERMLQAEPEDRYQAYEELLSDLKSVQGLAAAYSGEIPKDMEEGIVKSRRFTPLASPSPIGASGGRVTQAVAEVEDDTQRVPESRVSEAKEKAAGATSSPQARGAASVQRRDPKIFVAIGAAVLLGVGAWIYLGQDSGGGAIGGVPGNSGGSNSPPSQAYTDFLAAVSAETNLANQVKMYGDFLSANPGDHEAEVKASLATAQEALQNHLTTRLADMGKEVDGFMAGGQYEAALSKWNEFHQDIDPALFKTEVDARRSDTVKKIRAALAEEVKKAWEVAKAGNHDEAKTTLDTLAARFPESEELRAWFTGELDKLEALRKEMQAQSEAKALEEKTRQAQEVTLGLAKGLTAAVNNLDFADMVTRVQGVDLEALKDTPHMKRFEEIRASCETLADFKTRLTQNLQAAATGLPGPDFTPNPPCPLPVGGKTVVARVAGADETTLSVMIQEGNSWQPRSVTWRDVPAESVYEMGRQFATAAGSATEHFALGLYCVHRELWRQAEATLNRAAQLGQSRSTLEKHLARINEVLNKRAEALMNQCTTCLGEGRGESALVSLLTMCNEYQDTEFCRTKKAEMDSTMQKAFEAMGGAKARILSFAAASELSKWKQTGTWVVREGVLATEGGRSHKLESDDKNVDELAFMFRVVEDDGTKLVVRLGEYKLTLEFAKGTANAFQASTLKNATARVVVGRWHLIRLYRQVDGAKEQFRISFDGSVIHEFDKPAKRDDILIEVGPSKKNNLVEIDNLLVR